MMRLRITTKPFSFSLLPGFGHLGLGFSTSNLNVHQEDASGLQELSLGNNVAKRRFQNRVKIILASQSTSKKQELRKRLKFELEKVRSLVSLIEEKQQVAAGYGGNSNMLVEHHRVDNRSGAKRVCTEVASARVPRELARPFHKWVSIGDQSRA